MIKTKKNAESLTLKNQKSIQILFLCLGNSLKKVFPKSEIGKIVNP